jgi:cysteine-rich repeat protein
MEEPIVRIILPLAYSNSFCPNGVLDSGEDCDDNDFYSDDGCSGTCTQEVGWEWTGTPSVWHQLLQPQSNQQSTQFESTNEAIATQALVGVGAAASVISGVTSFSNPTGFWQMMNIMQLFMLIVLLEIYLPLKVLNVLNSSSYFSLSFDASYISDIPYLGPMYNFLDFMPPKANYLVLGVGSGSTLINILSLLLIMIGLGLFHWWILLWRMTWGKDDSSEEKSIIKIILSKTWSFMTFNVYVRLILQGYQHLLIVSVSGLYYGNFKTMQQTQSSITSLTTLLLWVVFLIVLLIALCKNWRKRLEELYVGLKSNSRAKLYQFVFILRKFVMILWMILFKFTPTSVYLILPIIFQFIYVWYIIAIRPFSKSKDNIVELFNEFTFSIMLAGLVYLKTEAKWQNAFTDIYVYLIMAPGIFIIAVTISKPTLIFSRNLYENLKTLHL